jgi:GMP synthase PP-ATPase subunit
VNLGGADDGTVCQAFAVLLPVRSVRVMGDARSQDYARVSRQCRYPHHQRDARRKPVCDVTAKPPGTIEWE